MFLDCDTKPSLRSKSLRTKHLEIAIEEAKTYLAEAVEGQIGIYDSSYSGSDFHGYVIKYPDQEPYFEASEEAA